MRDLDVILLVAVLSAACTDTTHAETDMETEGNSETCEDVVARIESVAGAPDLSCSDDSDCCGVYVSALEECLIAIRCSDPALPQLRDDATTADESRCSGDPPAPFPHNDCPCLGVVCDGGHCVQRKAVGQPPDCP